MVPCFLVVPTGNVRTSLRRHGRADAVCSARPEWHSHWAKVLVGEFKETATPWPSGEPVDRPANDDPRWPTKCDCGYEFSADDMWLVDNDDLYMRTDGQGAPRTLRDEEPGMMWSVPWYFDPRKSEGDDQPRRVKALADFKRGEKANTYLSSYYWHDHSAARAPLCVICPGGSHWCVDAVSSNGAGWEVTGDAPVITCAPSIDVPRYHGFLRNGVFSAPV